MRSYDELYQIAVARKGGAEALEAILQDPLPPSELAAIPDDRWLSAITKRVFQAGFVWRVIEDKWPGFEAAFEGFAPRRWAMMSDDDLDRLLADTRIVRNGPKILSVRDNAQMVVDIAASHDSMGAFVAGWPDEDYVGLLHYLARHGSRLGGNSGQYLLRFAGKDAFILSGDVVAALRVEGVIDGAPGSRKATAAIQAAFNRWRAESGRPFNHISRILAHTVDFTS